MPGLGGLASAFQSGWQSEGEEIRDRRARREALQDEERKTKVAGLVSARDNLIKILPSLKGTPDYDKTQSQMADIDQAIAQEFHPIKNPGALQRSWPWLQNLIHKGKPALTNVSYDPTTTPDPTFTPEDQVTLGKTDPYTREKITPGSAPTTTPLPQPIYRVGEAGTPASEPITLPSAPITIPGTPVNVRPAPEIMSSQQRQLWAQRDKAKAQAALEAAGAGLSPEEEVGAKLRTATALLQQFGENMTDEDKKRFSASALYAALGMKEAPDKYSPQVITFHDPNTNKDTYYGFNLLTGRLEPAGGPEGQQMVPKTAPKGLVLDSKSGQIVDKDKNIRYTKGNPKNPPDVQTMFAEVDKTTAAEEAFKLEQNRQRGSAYNDSRPMSVMNTRTGDVMSVSFSDYKKDTTLYVPMPEYDKWSGRVNFMEDVRGSSRIVRKAIDTLQAEGGFDIASKLANAIAQSGDDGSHAKSVTEQLLASGALGTLTPHQRDFAVQAAALIEQAMGMRSILGTGVGSADMRNAIAQTIPNLLTPDADLAIRRLNTFDGALERLHRYIPNNIRIGYGDTSASWYVGDKPAVGSELETGTAAAQGRGGAGGGGTAGAGGAGGSDGGTGGAKQGRSIAAVKRAWLAAPENRGKTITDDEVRQMITKDGRYVATP